MKRGMSLTHVQVLRTNGSLIPQVGLTQCSPACIFYTYCKNFQNRETCIGFKLIENGQNEAHIFKTIRESQKLYIENTIAELPKYKAENQEIIVRDVLRYLNPDEEDFTPKAKTRLDGFQCMLTAATKRSIHNESTNQKNTFFKRFEKPQYLQKTNREIGEHEKNV